MENQLSNAFKQTTYQVSGHGDRNIQVLKDALSGIEGERESDMYGKGEVIEEFQNKMAALLGKPASVFFPSGTMAQQIALRIWCDEKGLYKVGYHPLCHLQIHEENGLRELHHIEAVLLADKDRLINLSDIIDLKEDVTCILLELPQREIGGQLPDYKTLEEISATCRARGIKLHLDGARLFEILPFYQKTAAQICELFDSVYVSFYKGIGGIAGAILAGDLDLVEKAIVWKRRHGGDLISLYPYILSAEHYFNQRIGNMGKYYSDAMELAEGFNRCHGTKTLPSVPVSNMFHVHFAFPKDVIEQILITLYEETGIGLTGMLRDHSENECYFEVSIGDLYQNIPKENLHRTLTALNESLSKA